MGHLRQTWKYIRVLLTGQQGFCSDDSSVSPFLPLLFPSKIPNSPKSRFDRLRYVEIKHGRISMLAVAGHLIQQNFRFPGMLSTSADLSFADMPNGLAALSKIPALGLFQIIAFIGFLELGVMKQKEGSFAGDMTLAGEPYAWTKFSDEVKEQKRVRQCPENCIYL